MGRVTTVMTVENMGDLYVAERGLMPDTEVRRVTIPDALVDTGATLLSLPASTVAALGLKQVSEKRVISSVGPASAPLYQAVRLTIQGRSCTMDVLGVPDGVPPLVGQIPLEHLDLVVDLRNPVLTGNPAHGGEHVYEMFAARL